MTQVKFFFGVMDLEEQVSRWLREQPRDFTLLRDAMSPIPAATPESPISLAVSVWYESTPPASIPPGNIGVGGKRESADWPSPAGRT